MENFIYREKLPVGRIALELEGAKEALLHFYKHRNVQQIVSQKSRIYQLKAMLNEIRKQEEVKTNLTSIRWLRLIDYEIKELDTILQNSDELISSSMVLL